MSIVDTGQIARVRHGRDPRDEEIRRLKARIEDLEELAGLNEVKPFRLKCLQRREAEFLSLLLRRDFVSHEHMRMSLSDTASSDRYQNCYVSRIRKKLGPELCACIQTVWGSGTFIAAKDKIKVRAWIAAQAEAESR